MIYVIPILLFILGVLSIILPGIALELMHTLTFSGVRVINKDLKRKNSWVVRLFGVFFVILSIYMLYVVMDK